MQVPFLTIFRPCLWYVDCLLNIQMKFGSFIRNWNLPLPRQQTTLSLVAVENNFIGYANKFMFSCQTTYKDSFFERYLQTYSFRPQNLYGENKTRKNPIQLFFSFFCMEQLQVFPMVLFSEKFTFLLLLHHRKLFSWKKK